MLRSQSQQQMSLRSVTSWACANFKDDYHKIPKRKDYTTRSVPLSDLPHSTAELTAIVVGSAVEEIRPYFRATVEVLAWVKGDRAKIGYTTQTNDKISTVMYCCIDQDGVTFDEPFCWVLEAADETAARRFEALIHHAALLTGSKKMIRSSYYDDFREHFPGACSDIVEMALKRLAEWRRVTEPLVRDEDDHDDNATHQQRTVNLTEKKFTTITPGLSLEDAWVTLTRKLNTITRLHAQPRVTESVQAATVAKQDARKAQDKAKKEKDRAEKAQRRMGKAPVQTENNFARLREGTEQALDKEAENPRLEIAKIQDEAAESKAQHLATAKIHIREELRLHDVIKQLKQELATATSETVRAQEYARKTNEKSYRMHPKTEAMKSNRGRGSKTCNNKIDELNEAQGRTNNMENDLVLAERQRDKVAKVQQELEAAKEEARKANKGVRRHRTDHNPILKALLNTQSYSRNWQTSYEQISAHAAHAAHKYQVAVVWEAEYNTLRASLDNELGAQLGAKIAEHATSLVGSQVGSQIVDTPGGQMGNQLDARLGI